MFVYKYMWAYPLLRKSFLSPPTPKPASYFHSSWKMSPLPHPPLCPSLLAIWLLPLSLHWDSMDAKVTNDFLMAKFIRIFSLLPFNLLCRPQLCWLYISFSLIFILQPTTLCQSQGNPGDSGMEWSFMTLYFLISSVSSLISFQVSLSPIIPKYTLFLDLSLVLFSISLSHTLTTSAITSENDSKSPPTPALWYFNSAFQTPHEKLSIS